MRTALELAHHHPGRLRVRSDRLCDAAGAPLFERIEQALRAIAAVRLVKRNARAGSILVEYEPAEVEPDALVEVVAHAADLDLPPSREELAARRKKPAIVAIEAARELDAATSTLMGGRADLRSLVPLAMLGGAAYAFVTQKNRLPRWDNLAYWGFALFQSLHAEEIAEVRRRADSPARPDGAP